MSSWTDEEILGVTLAWRNVSENTRVSDTSQEIRATPFWTRVFSEFKTLVGGQTDRTERDLTEKFHNVKADCTVFEGYFNSNQEESPNESEEGLIELAKIDYLLDYDEDFEYVSAWQLLRDYIYI